MNQTCVSDQDQREVDDLYLLCGIAPPHIKRAVSSQLEKLNEENDPLQPLYEQDPARKRLKSRHSFLHSVEPLDGSACTRILTLWSMQPSPDNTTQALIQSHGITTSRFEWDMAHLVKPKSPPDRDWTMQIPYAEMGIQRGWTDNVRMWEWTDHDTPAGLPHPATTVCPWRPGRVKPRARSCAQHWAGVV